MSNDSTEQTKAATLFTGILFAAGGFAGLALAGVVLGFDYLLHGDPSEREQLRQVRAKQRRDRYADALAWLDADRTERSRARKAKRDWFSDDPATRGAVPSSGETFGRIVGRAWNRLLVGAVRFGRGWKQGRDEAQERRTAGDTDWWKPKQTASTAGEPVQEPTVATPDPEPVFRPAVDARDPQWTTSVDDVVDAEIVPDPQPGERPTVPVGEDEPRRPDETLDEYQRRLVDLENEVQENRNGHHPDPATTAGR